MADIDKMFRSEFAVLAEQPTDADLWHRFDPDDWLSLSSAIDSDILPPTSPHTLDGDTALGLFPAPNRRLGGPIPADVLPQPTVHLSDLSLRTNIAIPLDTSIQIPLSASSSGALLCDSPTDAYSQTDPSSEDMSSDDFDLPYPSDSDFLPSPISVNPSFLSAATVDPLSIPPSRRRSRPMNKVPVPIPNLTKKSRGRKVPTSNGEPIYAASRDKTKKGVRTYTCHVDGCRKCFVRGEHLKRHIRSIHTDEKPWMCTFGNCTRAFSRRDNLNQHLRIHKLQDGDD